jgi:hypothetical protein|tara:strand:- start:396 stop:635 length:240 start_codon:yes stop_codon:yes gene_type:complete
MSDYSIYRVRGKFTSDRDSENKRINVVEQAPYKDIREQLDLLWHDIDAGKFGDAAKTGEWYKDVKAVKDRFTKTDYPKE